MEICRRNKQSILEKKLSFKIKFDACIVVTKCQILLKN